jgi:gamma-glutamylcyclotransferase (GGCT)/AIG2-like uncharacterized protein YtfP
MTCEYLFVYGTLKKSAVDSKSDYLAPFARYVDKVMAAGFLVLYQDSTFDYPGLVYQPAHCDHVFGELYEILHREALFERLDDYEGCSEFDPVPHQYQREEICVVTSAGAQYTAWAYVYNWPIDQLQKIPGGDFS